LHLHYFGFDLTLVEKPISNCRILPPTSQLLID